MKASGIWGGGVFQDGLISGIRVVNDEEDSTSLGAAKSPEATVERSTTRDSGRKQSESRLLDFANSCK